MTVLFAVLNSVTIRYAVAYTGHLDLLRLDRGTKYDE